MSGTGDDAVAYPGMVEAAIRMAEAIIPADGVVAVVSKGDDALLALGGRRAVHFPADQDGRYAGYYPKDGVAAVQWLEQARRDGVDHLLLPATALWWLDHYAELRDHLARGSRELARNEGAGVVFSFRPAGAVLHPPVPAADEGGRTAQIASTLDALLPEDASVAYIGAPQNRPALGRRPTLTVAVPDRPGGYDLMTDRLRHASARYLVVDAGDDDGTRLPDVVAELGRRFRLVAERAAVCAVFDLRHDPEDSPGEPEVAEHLTEDLVRRAAALLPPGALVSVCAGGPEDVGRDELVDGQFLVVAAALELAPPPEATLMWSDAVCRIYLTGGGA